VHFAGIKFCCFEYTMYTMPLYRIAIIIDKYIRVTSNSEKANQYRFVQRGLLVVMLWFHPRDHFGGTAVGGGSHCRRGGICMC